MQPNVTLWVYFLYVLTDCVAKSFLKSQARKNQFDLENVDQTQQWGWKLKIYMDFYYVIL